MVRTDLASSRPDLDPQFFELVESPWLDTALATEAKA